MATKLEENVEKLIAYKLITSLTGAISSRIERKYKKMGEEIGEKFKNKQKLPEDSYLLADLKWSDEMIGYARRISLSLEEFKQNKPKMYKAFMEIYEKHKQSRREYIEYGIKEGDLSEDIYLEVIKEVMNDKITDGKAKEFYYMLKELNSSLKKGKKEKGLLKFLLPE